MSLPMCTIFGREIIFFKHFSSYHPIIAGQLQSNFSIEVEEKINKLN